MAQDDLQLDDEQIAKITQDITSVGEKSFLREKVNIIEDASVDPNPDSLPEKPLAAAPSSTQTPQRPKLREQFPDVKLRNLRTFQGDAAEAIKKGNATILTVALAEKKRDQEREKEKPPVNPETRKKFLTILISVILILLGAGSIYFLFRIQMNAPPPTTIQESEKTIVSYNQKISFDVDGATRDKLIEAIISQKTNFSLKVGEFGYIALTKKIGEADFPATTAELFNILDTKAPGSLLRSFDSRFMLGLYRDLNNEPFLLISISSFENAFDGMLKWEPSISDDVGAIFSRFTLPVVSAGEGTTSLAVLNPVSVGKFSDETIKNKDARVLLSGQGETILLYSFLNKQTLLITSSEEVLKVLIDKVVTSNISR